MPLCGHATLASAAVVLERIHPLRSTVRFHTASGLLSVRRTRSGRYIMDFPSRPTQPTGMRQAIVDALGSQPTALLADESDYLAVFSSANEVRALQPDFAAVARLDRAGIIATAPGHAPFDIVSRYFAPAKGIPEDPVTGGAHCALVPYWSQLLGKADLYAFQSSARGGEIRCRLRGRRVDLEGSCVFFFEGFAEI